MVLCWVNTYCHTTLLGTRAVSHLCGTISECIMFATDGAERDLVTVYKLFTRKRPEEMNKTMLSGRKQHFKAGQTRSQEKAASTPALLALTNSTVQ